MPPIESKILDFHEEGYSAKQIAQALRISVSAVDAAISSPVRNEQDRPEKKRHRRRTLCKECGVLVYKPCLKCKQDRLGPVAEEREIGEPLPGDPTEAEIYAMAAELRKKRREPNVPQTSQPGIREYWTVDVLATL